MNSLKKSGDILVLIGTILQTFLVVMGGLYATLFVDFFNGDYYYSVDPGYGNGMGMDVGYHSFGFGGFFTPLFVFFGLLAVTYLVFAWVAYIKTKKGSKGWGVYGIIQGVFCANLISIIGYVFLVIAIGDQQALDKQTINISPSGATVETPSSQARDEEIEALKTKLEILEREKAAKDQA